MKHSATADWVCDRCGAVENLSAINQHGPSGWAQLTFCNHSAEPPLSAQRRIIHLCVPCKRSYDEWINK